MSQEQVQVTPTTGTTTQTTDCKCTCCNPPNILIINPRLGQDKRVCPNTGHIYEDRGDGQWIDTGRTVADFIASQQPAPGPRSGRSTVIDPNAGVGEPIHQGQTGTQVDLHGQPFAHQR